MSGVTGRAGRLPPEALTGSARSRRRNVVFTIVLTVALLVGALGVAVLLMAIDAPDAIVVGTILAALPVGPLVACFMWLDRYEPEPLGLIAAALGWGAFVATSAALVVQLLEAAVLGSSLVFTAVVLAPISEEAAKGLFVLLLLYARRHEIHGILDGIVYAGMVGIGFAFTENILYLAGAYIGGDEIGPGGVEQTAAVFVMRGIFSPFAHPLFTVATGVGVGIAVLARSRFVRVAAPVTGYAVAVAAHSAWNGSLVLGMQGFAATYLFVMLPAFLLVAGFALWARGREGRMLTRALNDCAQRGLFGYHEVPWTVRLAARREARSFAQKTGGRQAARAMRDFQQHAVELGFLHDRYLRGRPPAGFRARGQQILERLDELRPYVAFPPSAGRTANNDGFRREGVR